MTLSLAQLRRCSVAVDLGAARTRVYLKGAGRIVDEPSVAAVNMRTGGLIAVGSPAERMAGRTPGHIVVVRPISGGAVVDIAMAQRMLRQFVGDKVRRAWRRKPLLRAAVCTPFDAHPLAQTAAVETLTGLGARRVELVDTLVAAAVGCGLPVEQPEATMIVICGATTTQVAVLSLGAIVAAETVPLGGDTIERVVMQYLRNEHELVLAGPDVRRPLHVELGGPDAGPPAVVHGRDAATGSHRSVRIDPEGLRAVMYGPMTGVIDAIGIVLRRCPPDLVADLADRGIMLAGGSAMLPGLDTLLRQATGMPVHVADEPDVCAVEGLGAMLEGRVLPLHLEALSV
ncbi:rod shape-determining protein [Streptomyces sp. XD-27]|uniref:rod shape-determining protein n=1 Tax=Streptomyces sp. XD-27 TaxID=3062779 RepID=UPI0026F43857|nr:rod shape-determining protein [Streptomyces sp. XD-27]WKX71766.1 rod shape-determining protein [Streptomyces sp. XD-27]